MSNFTPRLSRVVASSKEAMSIKYNTRVYDLRNAGRKLIVLSLGEAYFDIPLNTFADLPLPDIYHYSHSRGAPALRERIAQYYLSEYGVSVDPQHEIIITPVSKA